MINYHFLLARKHGVAEGFPLLASFGDTLPLTRRYEELTGPACAEFAAEHAELMFVSDGMVLAHHEFPDPTDLEKARVAKLLADARSADALNRQAQADLAEAERRAAAAKGAIKSLTAEQKELLRKEREAEEARAAAAARAKAEADAKAKAEADARAKAAADEQARLEALAARDTFRTEIAAQTDEQLRDLAATSGLKPGAEASRDEIIEALVLAAGFPPAESAQA